MVEITLNILAIFLAAIFMMLIGVFIGINIMGSVFLDENNKKDKNG